MVSFQNPKSCHLAENIILVDTWLTEDGGKFVQNARFFPTRIKNDLKVCPISFASFHYPPKIALITKTPVNVSGSDKITYEGRNRLSLFCAVAKAMNVPAVFLEPPPNLWG
jgi:hypothetical protein